MNNVRRKEISGIIDRLETLKAEIEIILEAETDYLYNIPENLQGSEMYEKSEIAIVELESAETYLEDLINSLTDSIE